MSTPARLALGLLFVLFAFALPSLFLFAVAHGSCWLWGLGPPGDMARDLLSFVGVFVGFGTGGLAAFAVIDAEVSR